MNKEATEILAKALEKDAIDHESGKYDNIGHRWDDVYGQILPVEEDFNNPIYSIAFRFWDDWGDASNHEWQYHEPITANEWPVIAREIVSSLRSGNMPSKQRIIDNFLPKPSEGIIKKIKTWFAGTQKEQQNKQ